MLGFRFFKAPATTYVIQHRSGQIVRQGAGLSFWYFAPFSVISQLPVSSVDVPYAFTEVTSDYQQVVVQGSMSYRIVAPEQLAAMLNYAVNANGQYISDDPSNLGDRLVMTAQKGARSFIQSQPLRSVLLASEQLVKAISAEVSDSASTTQLGVEVLEVAVASLKADAEMGKALQAEAREQLLREADEAVGARRNAAVEMERKIRENELQTEIVVAEKQRQVRETQMAAEIAVEEKRSQLVDTRVANEQKEAEARAAALQAILGPVRDVDWRTLMAMQGSDHSTTMISSAFEQLAAKAEQIGQLNITPDLLQSLLDRPE